MKPNNSCWDYCLIKAVICMHFLMPPTEQTKRQCCVVPNNLTVNITVNPPPFGTLTPQCQAPGSLTRPAMPPGTPYVIHLFSISAYVYKCMGTWAELRCFQLCINKCAYVLVCVCFSGEGGGGW